MTKRELDRIISDAESAGRVAAADCSPRPMHISGGYAPVTEGVCGFGWVKIRPANSALANRLKKAGKARTNNYNGGCDVWCSGYQQSYQRKMAFCEAYAEVIRNADLAGVSAYAEGRLD